MKRCFTDPQKQLISLLVVSSILLCLLGVGLKYTVGQDSQQIQETMAIAVPFVLLRGDVTLPKQDEDKAKDEGEAQEPVQNAGQETPATPDSEALAPVEVPPEPSYGFAPAPASDFDQTLFIGDSRTVGFALYARLGKADYFADVGMNMFNCFEKTLTDKNFSNQSLVGLMGSKQYNRVYIMLGINEIGYSLNALQDAFGTLLGKVREMQPQAKVILMANLAVTAKKAQANPTFSLDAIQRLNGMIAGFSDDKTVFYLDVNPYFADENGYLKGDMTGDGVHPYMTGYEAWSQWIGEHALVELPPAVPTPKPEESTAAPEAEAIPEVLPSPSDAPEDFTQTLTP